MEQLPPGTLSDGPGTGGRGADGAATGAQGADAATAGQAGPADGGTPLPDATSGDARATTPSDGSVAGDVRTDARPPSDGSTSPRDSATDAGVVSDANQSDGMPVEAGPLSPPSPPATWTEHWYEHKQVLALNGFSTDVALYLDQEVKKEEI
ncbi:MAG TPA: hypothetical protein VGG33_18090, partial [Polyangia bacterium]